MKVLITGGSGFIGMPVVRHFLNNGDNVKVIDVRKPTISHKNLEFVNKSIMDELSDDAKDCDIAFHFAAIVGVDNSDFDPLETMKINLEGAVNVFKSCVGAGLKRIIYASSSEVYGNPRELPIREDSVKGPVSIYGVSKLAAEIYANAYNHRFN